MRERFDGGPGQDDKAESAPEAHATPPAEAGKDEAGPPSAGRTEEDRKAEHAERVRAIAAARAAIEAKHRGPELSDEARAEIQDLHADLEEIDEINEAIAWNIEHGGLRPEEKRREEERLGELAAEREAVRRRIDAIKSGTAEGSQGPSVIRRVGIGKEAPPQPKLPWWKRLLRRE